MKYVLASKSPRRKELMKKISSSFEIDVAEIDEDKSYKLGPIEAVKDISLRKLQPIFKKHKNDVVIAADTIVVLDDKIIGKPKDEIDAFEILRMLSGRTHQVYTGYSIGYKDKIVTNIVRSDVTFNKLSKSLIIEYIATKSPLDKAGAYGVQDNNSFPIIKEVIGSIDNVVGFPVKEIKIDISKLIN